jgi:Protein of unknown function (DUF1569)
MLRVSLATPGTKACDAIGGASRPEWREGQRSRSLTQELRYPLEDQGKIFPSMKTLSNRRDQNEVLDRLTKVRPDGQPRRGTMSAHQMVCHLSDSFRASLDEKYISPSSTFLKRTLFKWVALWVPLPWPRGIKTRPEMDQQQGGTPPTEFASDLEKLRILLERFCTSQGEFAPHAMLGQMSRTERMRHAYLHMDHHLRQFGA